jgi:cysteinyl-tRNA synthetase
LRGEANKSLEAGLSPEARLLIREEFRKLGSVLGLFQLDSWQFNPKRVDDTAAIGLEEHAGVKAVLSDTDVEQYLRERNEARKKKNFSRADEIRKHLSTHGITIEDRPDGTSRWKR